MATQEQILEYVGHTPANTNIAVLKNLLDNCEGNIYDDPNNLVGLWFLNSDEQEEEDGKKLFILISPEGDGFGLTIDHDLVIQSRTKFNPNGQIEVNDESMGSWELLNGTLSIVFDEEEAYQCEKYSMADMLYEWAANYIFK